MTEKWKRICSQLDYAYQPIVNAYTGDVFGYEALLRNWLSAGFESIFDVFDSAFLDRVLYTLDLELRRKAILKIRDLNGMDRKTLFYNLDNRVLDMPDYSAGNTLELLSELGVTKSQFYFELSERHEFNSNEETIEILNKYKAQNLRIAIDDYGSGYSGLQLLYHSEPDVIKIDRFFIDGVHKDHKKKLFAENIVNMAHLMGIKVVAEGIETEEELFFCRDIGCDYLQGYYIARPEQDISKLQMSYKLEKQGLYGKRKSDNRSKLIEERLSVIDPVGLNDQAVDTLKMFQKNTGLSLLPVVNSDNEPLGVIREKDLKQYVYSPYGISLFQKRYHRKGLESFIYKIPIAEVNTSLEKILDISAVFSQNEGIVITRNGKYLGILEPASLIQLIYEQKLAQARDQNPLTELPGNFSIHKELTNTLKAKNPRKRVVFFDFNNFKPFNDSYGFRMGDRLIILFAEILKKTFSLSEDFIAHIGGDDFLVIQNNIDDDEHCRPIKEVQRRFAESALSYYSEEHREQGCLRAKNRTGRWDCFPLMTVAAAVLDIVSTDDRTLDDVNGYLSELKKEAKNRDDHFARKCLCREDRDRCPSRRIASVCQTAVECG